MDDSLTFSFLLALLLLASPAADALRVPVDWDLFTEGQRADAAGFKGANGVVHYPAETHFGNVKQLTNGGANAEAYFSFDNKKIVFQATNTFGAKCDQIFEFDLENGNMMQTQPTEISDMKGACTCSFFMPNDKDILYASTYKEGQAKTVPCPTKLCKYINNDPHLGKPSTDFLVDANAQNHSLAQNGTLKRICNTTYTWDIFPGFDIYVRDGVNPRKLQTLVAHQGYDAEAVVSPNKTQIVFTSMRSGDLELYTMNIDGSNIKQITNDLGYDGGAFFSPDGKRLIFRASRPHHRGSAAVQEYQTLLSFNLVSPMHMDLMVVNADGTNLKQITNFGGASWAPYYHPNNVDVIFSSNHHTQATGGMSFDLFMIRDNGTCLEQITHSPGNGFFFNAFPMFSYDGKKLIFASTRNGANEGDINLFIADWLPNVTRNCSMPLPIPPSSPLPPTTPQSVNSRTSPSPSPTGGAGRVNHSGGLLFLPFLAATLLSLAISTDPLSLVRFETGKHRIGG